MEEKARIIKIQFPTSTGGDGAEVIYALRNNDRLANLITEELAKEGQNTREYYQRRLPSNPSQDYYFILRDTKNNESVIVEYGFLDSSNDDVEQLTNNWQNYAEAVVKAIAEYKGIKYIPKDLENNYIVQKGDSLWSISKKYNMTVNELKELNKLTNNLLSVGQILKIMPQNVSEQNIYIVEKGDTLYSIAKKYNITTKELKGLNNLSSDLLSIGQSLNVKKSSITSQDNYSNYMVKFGDTLYNIAKKNGISIDELKNINDLSTNILSINQVLKIPMQMSYKEYVVKPGDTLYSIAREFNTTVNDIKNLNNLNSTILSIGQKLQIPKYKK